MLCIKYQCTLNIISNFAFALNINATLSLLILMHAFTLNINACYALNINALFKNIFKFGIDLFHFKKPISMIINNYYPAFCQSSSTFNFCEKTAYKIVLPRTILQHTTFGQEENHTSVKPSFSAMFTYCNRKSCFGERISVSYGYNKLLLIVNRHFHFISHLFFPSLSRGIVNQH